jgi:hypothetical protein
MALPQKEVVDELKAEWKKLWRDRFDDRQKAEGVATTDYSSLFVDRGTVVHATRDFKALNFEEILERHKVENAERFIQPSPQVGGWNKFIKTKITSQPSRHKRAESYCPEKKPVQQPKKGGRGWLHK